MAMKTQPRAQKEARCSLGIEGLDKILGGGLPRSRVYLVQGEPGVGKTTLALQFLLEGARLGEAGLYITLSETKEELKEKRSGNHEHTIREFSLGRGGVQMGKPLTDLQGVLTCLLYTSPSPRDR